MLKGGTNNEGCHTKANMAASIQKAMHSGYI